MENRELKPCPFCGGRASVSQGVSVNLEELGKGQYEYVCCERCGARTNKFFSYAYGSKTRAVAIFAWNAREDENDK